MDNEFIMLPNLLVWQSDSNGSKDDTYIHVFGEKICMVLTYLDGCINRYNYCYFTLKQMLKFCDMKVDNHKGKSLDQIKGIINGLIDKKIITNVQVDINKVKPSEMIVCKFNMPIEAKDNKNTNFFTISRKTFIKIVTTDIEISRVTSLKVYYYLISRIYMRPKDSGDIDVTGGKAETFYDKYENICADLEMSETTFKKYLNKLNQLELIFYDSIGMVSKDGDFTNANNVYCKEKKYIEYALAESKGWYIDNGYRVLGTKINANKKSLSGAESRLKQLKQQGKDTTELEKKIAELKEVVFDKDTFNKAEVLKEIKEKHKYLLDIGADEFIDIFEDIEDYFPEECFSNEHKLTKENCEEILKTINQLLYDFKISKHKANGWGNPNPFWEYEQIVKDTEEEIKSYYDIDNYIEDLL